MRAHQNAWGGVSKAWNLWLQKQQQGSCIAVENSRWGCWQVHRGMSVALLHMCNAFPAEMGEQMILMSFNDVIIARLMHWR